jgi:hypothetical protein
LEIPIGLNKTCGNYGKIHHFYWENHNF